MHPKAKLSPSLRLRPKCDPTHLQTTTNSPDTGGMHAGTSGSVASEPLHHGAHMRQDSTHDHARPRGRRGSICRCRAPCPHASINAVAVRITVLSLRHLRGLVGSTEGHVGHHGHTVARPDGGIWVGAGRASAHLQPLGAHHAVEDCCSLAAVSPGTRRGV